MAKIPHIIVAEGDPISSVALIKDFVDKKLISSYGEAGKIIIARYGVNKSTLNKILKKESK